jgi:hypothetical protein
MNFLLYRQIIIAEGITIKLINFGFDQMQFWMRWGMK